LLYLKFRRLTETLIVMASLPFALVGGLWLVWLMGFNLCRRRHERRGGTPAPEDDDGHCHHRRPAADPLEHRHRRGGRAAHCRADDGRHAVVAVPTLVVIPAVYALVTTLGLKRASAVPEGASATRAAPRASRA
jgi:hypothetical protein